jgi:hypothetical protein
VREDRRLGNLALAEERNRLRLQRIDAREPGARHSLEDRAHHAAQSGTAVDRCEHQRPGQGRTRRRRDHRLQEILGSGRKVRHQQRDLVGGLEGAGEIDAGHLGAECGAYPLEGFPARDAEEDQIQAAEGGKIRLDRDRLPGELHGPTHGTLGGNGYQLQEWKATFLHHEEQVSTHRARSADHGDAKPLASRHHG